MEYSYLDLAAYLLIYSFLGWVLEVCIIAIKEKRFCNRGFFNFPFSLSYGIIMDLLIILLPTLEGKYIMQGIVILAVTASVSFIAGGMAKRISRNRLWQYDAYNIFGGEIKGAVLSLGIAAGFATAYYLIHPIVFFVMQLIPKKVTVVITITLVVMLILDFFCILYVLHIHHANKEILALQEETRQRKIRFSKWIYKGIWKRIYRAYPLMEAMDEGEKSEEKPVFAKGMCLDKIIWIFLICAFGGDIIETLYCRITAGVWMSRSSVIYGPFSLVWGIGAALLTMVLQRLAGKDDRYVFISGAILGGVFEYMCSVFTEVFFGTTFWDYSWMPFNIGGRTNLLYCIFWGIIAVVWIKICYPRLSTWIEKIPLVTGKVVTWLFLILMICNALISAMAMIRYTQRQKESVASNVIEEFLDNEYPDALVEKIWPNMVLHE